MTFKRRAINVTFGMSPENPNNTGKDNILDLTGYRTELVLSNPGLNFITGTLQMRIYGMKEADMNAYSTDLIHPYAIKGDQVKVSVGNVGEKIKQIFLGTIFQSYIDYNSMPEVNFVVSARDGYLHQILPSAASSFDGETDVSEAIQSIAVKMGYAFENLGVDRKISNQYLSGTAMDQLKKIVDAANIVCQVDERKVTIWPPNKAKDQNVIEVNPDNGLIGYPTFIPSALQIRTEFNPELKNSKIVRLKSSVKKACGDWQIVNVNHELSTVTPGGAWFSSVDLRPEGYILARI